MEFHGFFCGGLGFLGGQDAAMMVQDGAKTAQDDTKMAPRGRQDGVISFQDAPKTRPDAPKAAVNSNMSKISKSIEKTKEFHGFWDGLGGSSEAKLLPRRPKIGYGWPLWCQDAASMGQDDFKKTF